jgi:ferredoxin-NADP reductase
MGSWSGTIATNELIAAVRAKINDFGYSPSRVLFELFQNADDACRQLDDTTDEACFRVELVTDDYRGFRVVHWGRPINHLGARALSDQAAS